MTETLPMLGFALLGLAMSSWAMIRFAHAKYWIFHPMVLFLALSALDAYVPALIWSFHGIPNTIQTASVLTANEVSTGLVLYLAAYALMSGGYVFGRACANTTRQSGVWLVRPRRFWWLLLILLIASVVQLALMIQSFGSAFVWFESRLIMRWDPNFVLNQKEMPFWRGLLESAPSRQCFSAMVLMGVYYRNELKNPLLLGVVMPIAAVVLALATFYRGSALLLFVGLAHTEFMRRQDLRASTRSSLMEGKAVVHGTKRRITALLIFSVVLFVLYGFARDYYGSRTRQEEFRREANTMGVVSSGFGLFGATHIAKHYGVDVPLFYGKTYFDMMLLPVPRAIYTSKPLWYGIDDITRALGWPETSQSAVSIPGEAYANFKWLGLVLLAPWGIAAYIVYSLCSRENGSAWMFTYSGAVVYIIFISNWMSFTGVVNQLVIGIAVYATARLSLRRDRLTDQIAFATGKSRCRRADSRSFIAGGT